MSDSNKILLSLLLEQVSGLGQYRIKNLVSIYDSIDHVEKATEKNLSKVEGIGEQSAAEIKRTVFDYKKAERVISQIQQHNAEIIGFWSENYPKRLKVLDGMPVLLYFKGNREVLNSEGVAVVGTRTPSSYGKSVTEFFTKGLVQSGLTIYSGFARGVDTIAHSVSLSEGGSTIAVLGSGFNNIYPSENKNLLPKIFEKGGILTEFHPDTKPDGKNFPQRNRIISGLALGSLVVEAAETGGALITAAYALEQNKEVFAVPGEIFADRSKGTNRLIMNGSAKLVLTPEDILSEINFTKSETKIPTKPMPELSIFELPVYEKLSSKPIHVDELATLLGLPVSELLIQLLGLEFKSVVRQLPGKYFVRI